MDFTYPATNSTIVEVKSQPSQPAINPSEVLTFIIAHRGENICKVSLAARMTTTDLLECVIEKLKDKYGTIVGLQSKKKKEVLDYSLLLPYYCLGNYLPD